MLTKNKPQTDDDNFTRRFETEKDFIQFLQSELRAATKAGLSRNRIVELAKIFGVTRSRVS